MYQVRRPARSEFVPIRTLQYHVLIWGEPDPAQVPLVMVHGWMDVAASYQFVVDAMRGNRYIIAPDWRGFGQTDAANVDCFWFPDYLADLDALLDHYAPDGQVDLVGHSMGGNVVMLYGGIRPERVRRLVNLEGFGMPATTPDMAPERYARWMDEIKALRQGDLDLRGYDDVQAVARRLRKTNPRLSPDKAEWLALRWASPDAQGVWRVLGHAGHKLANPQLYRVEEVHAIHARLEMPVLSVEASDNSMDFWWKGRYTLDEYHQRLKVLPNVRIARVDDAGHMLHHDQPEVLAAMIEQFLD